MSFIIKPDAAAPAYLNVRDPVTPTKSIRCEERIERRKTFRGGEEYIVDARHFNDENFLCKKPRN